MIQFSLRCDQDHRFQSWFQSAAAFDTLRAAGMVACVVCGSGKVEKTLMAPRVVTARRKSLAPPQDQSPDPSAAQHGAQSSDHVGDSSQNEPPHQSSPTQNPVSLSTPDSPEAEAIAKLRREVEANSDYVGGNFAAEARKMHDGDSAVRSIYGEARPEEAKALLEEGIPVVPLPFMNTRKVN